MLKNFLLTALRSIRKRPLTSAIHILGLSCAVLCCLFVMMFLQYEWSWDRFHDKADRIYIANTVIESESYTGMGANTSPLLYETIKGQVPGLEAVARFAPLPSNIRREGQLFDETICFADPEFFDVISVQPMHGDCMNALDDLNSMVITESFAARHFPDTNPVGQMLDVKVLDDYVTLMVAGVVEDLPSNTIFEGSAFVSYEQVYSRAFSQYDPHWGMQVNPTILLLEDGLDAMEFEVRLRALMDDLGVTNQYLAFADAHFNTYFYLQPLTRIHVWPPFTPNPHNFETETSISATYVLLGIGFAILLIACINVTTLSIGNSTTRSKEVGVRKVMGALRTQLTLQFWFETAVIVALSTGIGVLAAKLLVPVFQELSGIDSVLHFDLFTVSVLTAIWFVLTVASGLYPALVMASFSVQAAFRGAIRVGGKGRLRRVLVFVQFVLTIGLLSSTFIMKGQIQHLLTASLGFDSAQVVSFPVISREQRLGRQVMERLQQELASDPQVTAIAGASCMFGDPWIDIWWDEEGESMHTALNNVDYDYFDILGIELVEGRFFDRNIESDLMNAVIVNEAYLEEFGIENPIGQQFWAERDAVIVGVVRDFHFESLHENIGPALFTLHRDVVFCGPTSCNIPFGSDIQYVLVEIAPGATHSVLQKVERLWPEVAPSWSFDFNFLDDRVAAQYETDRRWNRIISYASMLAMIIAITGLIGLALIDVNQRTKEIGIRKVLGGDLVSILSLFLREIVLLIAAAVVVATPIALLLTSRWLETFAYRIPTTWWAYLLAGGITICVAVIAVGYFVLRAAVKNPVESLRCE